MKNVVDEILHYGVNRFDPKKRQEILQNGAPIPDIRLIRDIQKDDKIRTMIIDWYDIHDWLTGSILQRKLYCWPCLLYNSLSSNDGLDCMNDRLLKHFDTWANRHSETAIHKEAYSRLAEELQDLDKRKSPLKHQKSAQEKEVFMTMGALNTENLEELVSIVKGDNNVDFVSKRGFSALTPAEKRSAIKDGRNTPITFSFYKHPSKVFNIMLYYKYKWLTASNQHFKAYCWPCLIFPKENFDSWTDGKPCDDQVELERICEEHNNKTWHRLASRKLFELRQSDFWSHPNKEVENNMDRCLQSNFLYLPLEQQMQIIADGRPTPNFLEESLILGKIKPKLFWYDNYHWMAGSKLLKQICCWSCLLFRFENGGKETWKTRKGSNELFAKHELKPQHLAASEHLQTAEFLVKQKMSEQFQEYISTKFKSENTNVSTAIGKPEEIALNSPLITDEKFSETIGKKGTNILRSCEKTLTVGNYFGRVPIFSGDIIIGYKKILPKLLIPAMKQAVEQSGNIVDKLLRTRFRDHTKEQMIKIVENGRPELHALQFRSYKQKNKFTSHNYNFEWLTSSSLSGKLYCWPCLLFRKTFYDKFCCSGYEFNKKKNLSLVSKVLKNHNKSSSHKQAEIKLKEFVAEILISPAVSLVDDIRIKNEPADPEYFAADDVLKTELDHNTNFEGNFPTNVKEEELILNIKQEPSEEEADQAHRWEVKERHFSGNIVDEKHNSFGKHINSLSLLAHVKRTKFSKQEDKRKNNQKIDIAGYKNNKDRTSAEKSFFQNVYNDACVHENTVALSSKVRRTTPPETFIPYKKIKSEIQ